MIFSLSVLSLSVLTAEQTLERLDFDSFLAHHRKAYSAEEYTSRKALFEQSKRVVKAHNALYRTGHQRWYMALNEFADWTPSEFATLRSTKRYSPSKHAIAQTHKPSAPNPDSVDWRDKKAVTPVKNQGGCGSCWAFSATETVESAYFLASGKLLTLSPQTYVNCVKNPKECGGTGGCEGATMELAFNLTVTSGIATEDDLPYRARDETCRAYTPAVKASGYVKNPVNDAAALETALATKGPMSVTVAADSWQLYGGGVFEGCSSGGIFHHGDNTLDHGVQAVGYTQDYWIVRNRYARARSTPLCTSNPSPDPSQASPEAVQY